MPHDCTEGRNAETWSQLTRIPQGKSARVAQLQQRGHLELRGRGDRELLVVVLRAAPRRLLPAEVALDLPPRWSAYDFFEKCFGVLMTFLRSVLECL